MNEGSGVTPLRAKSGNHDTQRRLTTARLISVSADHARQFFQGTFQQLFDGIDDAFFDLANHAHSNNEQNVFFEAMREARLKRRQIEQSFLARVRSLFEHPVVLGDISREKQTPTDEPALSLVDHADLEEEVAMTSLATKIRANHAGELLAFQARFTWLVREGKPIQDDARYNPLEPRLLCDAFVDACAILDMHIRERLIVYKQFDKCVMSHLGHLLDDLNQRLIASGVLPKYRPGVAGQTSETRSTRRRADDAQADTAQSAQAGSQDATGNLLLSELVNALHAAVQQQKLQYQFRPTTPDAIVLNGTDLIHVLSALQSDHTDLSPAGDPLSPEQIRTQLKATLQNRSQQSGKEHALREYDEDLINLVSMLFEFILNDYNLSPPIQVLISRLQIPILKVAITDKSFFGRSGHPARRLLNALAKAGMGWADASEQARDKLYQEIHRVVGIILDEFDGDLALFERLLDEFQHFLEREEKRARIVEARTREAEQGRLLSRRARKLAELFISERIAAQPLPPAAIELLRDGWTRVLFLAYLKDGENGFRKAAHWVDNLLWCLKPHSHEEERKLWVQLVPTLLRECRLRLADTGFAPVRLQSLITDLKTALTETFKQQSALAAQEAGLGRTTRSATPPSRPKPSPIPNAVEREARKEDATLAHFLQQTDALPLGTWVDFEMLNGTHVRCKLSARLDDDTLIFVNRMGLKVMEKTREEMAQALRRQHARVLESGALVDRALNAVAERLRSKAA